MLFLVGGATRGEGRQLDVGDASPRGRASHEAGRALGAVSCGRRALAAKGVGSVLEKLAPRSGLPQGGSCARCCFLWEARPRGEWRQLDVGEASPRGRASHKAGRALGAVFCRGRALAAKGVGSVLEKLRPEIGTPTRWVVRWMLFSVGGAPRGEGCWLGVEKLRPEVGAPTKAGRALGGVFCGRRDPRRMAPARCWRSFAPSRGSYKGGSCAGCCFLWEARPAANGAGSVLEKLRPEGRPPAA